MALMLEQNLKELEVRPATVDIAEQQRRIARFRHFRAINRFEGLTSSAVDKQLFKMFASGKISTSEYLSLCLGDVRNNGGSK
jgi:hypothetical protein